MDSQTSFPTEFLNSLSLSGLPEHELHLRVDSVVILLRNMDIKGGHCNGTRYLVKHIGEYRLVLHKLEAGPDDKDKVLILPRIPLRYNGVDLPFEICRLQFPVKLAFALTINRSQGQSVFLHYLRELFFTRSASRSEAEASRIYERTQSGSTQVQKWQHTPPESCPFILLDYAVVYRRAAAVTLSAWRGAVSGSDDLKIMWID
ncbi:hypothetical protein THAOC_08090 [Thalassiosira oceanica]|uniref:DNA helicase Pif1-like 2B domain-containing protein n=1 Tax=Thalassiosira oceanica TaxID=159749 RepID=K0SVU1_THAOC|nr:hypothetical protein THAOC_08090 [Thalassiosira oceanica]|eukprot:EJK70538.1 hypothetical protein THAOC_08090 [Thalassiosira oceanica]